VLEQSTEELVQGAVSRAEATHRLPRPRCNPFRGRTTPTPDASSNPWTSPRRRVVTLSKLRGNTLQGSRPLYRVGTGFSPR
jgi:hypothetical protein